MKRASLVTLSFLMPFIFSAASANASWFNLQGNWAGAYASMQLSVKDKNRDDGHNRKNAKTKHHDGKKHGKKHQGDEPVESSTPPPPAPAGQVAAARTAMCFGGTIASSSWENVL